MIKLTLIVFALSTCPSSYATYYSSSESSSEIIGFSPDFQRLFPEFTSNSFHPSSSFKGHKPEKPSVDGFTPSESQNDGFKLAKPALAGHSGSSPPGGSLQTSHHGAHNTRDDVLPFPSELSDFWTSQLIRTQHLQSTISDRAGDGVYTSSSSRVSSFHDPRTHRIGYNPRPVSDGYSHPEEESVTDTSRYTSYDSISTPSTVGNRYRFELKTDGHHGKVPVFDTSSSHEARPVADGHSVLGSSQSTASRSRAGTGSKNSPSQLNDGFTVEAKSDGHRKVLESKLVRDKFSSTVNHFKDSQSKHDEIDLGSDQIQSIINSKIITVKPVSAVTSKTTTVEPVSAVTSTTTRVKPVSTVTSKTTTVKPVSAVTSKTTTVKPVSAVTKKTTTVKPVSAVTSKTTTVKPVSAVTSKTTTVKPVAAVTSKTTTVKPVSAVTSKTTTVKPVSAGFFSKFNNGGNFAVQRPRTTQDLKSTSTNSDLIDDVNRGRSSTLRPRKTHSGEESHFVENKQDLSAIRSNNDGDEDGVLAYLVSEEGNPGSDFLVTKSALIQSGLVFNKVVRMSASTVDAGGQVEILDETSFHLTGLRYAGPGPARWIAGTIFPVGLYSDTVVLASWTPGVGEEYLTLPGQVTVADISWLALYCSTCTQGKVVMQVYIPETFL